MNLSDRLGSITKGVIANLIITNPIRSVDEIPYSLADNKIKNLLLKGEFYKL
jgi:imidazolonepropionase